MLTASPEMVGRILEIGRLSGDCEACGILVKTPNEPDGALVHLDNIAEDPTRSYEIDSGELVKALDRVGVGLKVRSEDLIIWHTHPSGLIGPSEGDMRRRIHEFTYMVVALPNGPGVMF